MGALSNKSLDLSRKSRQTGGKGWPGGQTLVGPLSQDYSNIIYYYIYIVPAVPTLVSVNRVSGSLGSVDWIPLTPAEARGLLTSLEIAYKSAGELGLNCSSYSFIDSEKVIQRENLFEHSTAIITGLQRNYEYCVAIQASTSAGESGFSNPIKLPCKGIHSCKGSGL